MTGGAGFYVSYNEREEHITPEENFQVQVSKVGGPDEIRRLSKSMIS